MSSVAFHGRLASLFHAHSFTAEHSLCTIQGSGQSDGKYVTLGYREQEDLAFAIRHLRDTGTVSTIGLWGRSMGAVTALLYSQNDPSIAGIVSIFSSCQAICLSMMFTIYGGCNCLCTVRPIRVLACILFVAQPSTLHRIHGLCLLEPEQKLFGCTFKSWLSMPTRWLSMPSWRNCRGIRAACFVYA